MVDAIVSYAVGRLGDFLTQEAVILQGIEAEVQWLRTELRFMRSYLKDADKKQGSNERIRTWISELQDIAYDTEDVIESFMLNDNNTNDPIHSSNQGMIGSYISKKAKHYDIGKDIEDLKKRVLEITRLRQTYGINDLGIIQNNMTSGGDGSRITTPYGDEDLDVVGFDDDYQYLQTKLFDGTQSRSIISILGMGGLGKTTLARKLYNNNKIRFTKHAWICVSQEWNTEDLFRKLIKSFLDLTNKEREKVDKMELSELVRYLRNLLEKCQYLVVIDDLWHKEAWESIKKVFPENKNGSRIIITTRKEDAAELEDHTTLVHKLRFLRDEESLSLFCKKAFPGNNGVCPNNHFEKLGKEMTAKCGGLPLAIIVLGGLLSRKEFHEWSTVKKHIWREVKEKAITDISGILDLSYNDLPINIKSCFLYLGLFPEDASIEVEELVMLWVAEQFIPIDEEGNRTLEEVSEYYFKELLGRNLVQTVRRNWRMTSQCRVHDLLRDLALKKARETNFLCVQDQIGSSSSLHTTSCRRFVVQSGFDRDEFLNHLHKKVRTLHLLDDKYFDDYSESLSIVWSFRLLRVLQLERVNLIVPFEWRIVGVGEMIHLRYLGLKDTSVDDLPNTIGNLKVLQTLEIFFSNSSVRVPKDMGKLKELRYLRGNIDERDYPNLAGLGNLQTLKLELGSSPNLEVIDFDFLATLNNLRTLEICVQDNCQISIESLMSCKELIELKISGGFVIREVPKDIHKYLTKLKYLQLKFSNGLEEDPIPKLEMLPNLLVLHLSYLAMKRIPWTFTAKGFPQLEFLKLEFGSYMMFQVDEKVEKATPMELLVDEVAMPRLRFLCLEDNELKQTLFPERFWSLSGKEAMNWKFV